jgi:hypothetical protein
VFTYGAALPHASDMTVDILAIEGVITAPQGSVPMTLPGKPHFEPHFAIQSAPFRLRRAQAGPASPPGREYVINKKEQNTAAKPII